MKTGFGTKEIGVLSTKLNMTFAEGSSLGILALHRLSLHV